MERPKNAQSFDHLWSYSSNNSDTYTKMCNFLIVTHFQQYCNLNTETKAEKWLFLLAFIPWEWSSSCWWRWRFCWRWWQRCFWRGDNFIATHWAEFPGWWTKTRGLISILLADCKNSSCDTKNNCTMLLTPATFCRSSLHSEKIFVRIYF